ncbi:MAG: multicopper oxidase domain-containing protein [Rhodospirillaceae bacterium]|jgi:FtsP/CotA-like multicopper oxidase with cupredoxin domain|nr:multicopper oxidase domain-containing protein [Rhodospirillaceae bacterium]
MTQKITLTVASLGPLQEPDGQAFTGERLCYNGTIPGPVIRVQEGEAVDILVRNDCTQPTSVHWHGIHQIETSQHDGVPLVSHGPIEPGNSHNYQFTASPAGTHWYHSHTGLQYSEGLFGALIVEAKDDPFAGDYDRDAILLISDWFHSPSDDLLQAVIAMGLDGEAGHGDPPPVPGGSMPSGMDMDEGEDLSDIPFEAALINGKGGRAELERVEVSSGERIRLRIINGSGTFDFHFAVEAHQLKVIAADGNHLQPFATDSLILAPGERYDVILHADQPAADYVMHAKTLEKNSDNGVMATLAYNQPARDGKANTPLSNTPPLKVTDLRPFSAQPVVAPDRTVHLQLAGTMSPYQWMIGIDGAAPRPLGMDKDGQTGLADLQSVQPRLNVKQGDQLRMIINGADMSHPFHLHGHSFQVLGLSEAHAGNYDNDPLNLTNPITKDTINIQEKGWAVIQWEASNVGAWLFHCHIEWHAAVGMGLLIIVEK